MFRKHPDVIAVLVLLALLACRREVSASCLLISARGFRAPMITPPPAAPSANLHASFVNGSVRSDLPMVTHGRLDRRRSDGKIGNGEPDLNLKAVNGNIEANRQ